MRVSDLMHDIRELDLVLPEFQREYVWTRTRAKELIESLLRGYPTGSLLVWKTSQPPEIKNNAVSPDRIGTTSVLLDGQQRLTTLYLLTQDQAPPYYRQEDIVNDPRNLYYDLATGDLQFYQATRMRHDPAWVPVTDCFRQPATISVFQVARKKADDAAVDSLAETYNTHLNALANILTQDYPVQTVPSNAGIDEAIDVFDRVNSLGTKLSEAELALAHIAGKWPEARREMKHKIDALSAHGFGLDLTFMVRALTAVVRGRALFQTIHDADETELTLGWKHLGAILDYLIGILPTWAHIHSAEDLPTTNVLIPPIAFLARYGGQFHSEGDVRGFVRWLYAAATWARYTSQTDQRLEHDVAIVAQTRSPWPQLENAIVDQRGRIEMKAADLEGRGVQTPFYRIAFVLAKRYGAIDWYTGSPIVTKYDTEWHSHHIFPKAVLYGSGRYSTESHVDEQKVNEIANRAFLSAHTNLHIQDTPPAETLTQVEKRFPGALAKQFIPTNPELWKLENYEAFLDRRRELIAHAYNETMEDLREAHVKPERRPAAELIADGESGALELKSTLRWDIRAGQVNKGLEKVIAKTVAGFLNSEGGTLLIGATDDGSIYGIESDMNTLGKKDRDGFEQALRSVLNARLGTEYGPYCRVCFETVDGRTICRVEIDRSPKGVYLSDGSTKEFYIRSGNTTQPLDAEAAHEYIGMHWAA